MQGLTKTLKLDEESIYDVALKKKNMRKDLFHHYQTVKLDDNLEVRVCY